jgi:hypothetical protein
MAWVKLDDHFDQHPKIAQLSDSAVALFVASLAYSNRNLTDGFIPRQVGLGQLRYCDGNTTPPINELEAVGLWEQVTGGWSIHDYDEYQPSRESVLADRAAARDRKAKSRMKSREVSRGDMARTNTGVTPPPVPVPVPQEATTTPNGFTAFHAKRAVAAVEERKRNGLLVKSPTGLAKALTEDADFTAESKRLWGHRDHESCKGSGFIESYAPGAGTVKTPCGET